MFLTAKYMLVVVAAAILAACGGGSENSGGTSLSGKVIDGPISGATVCLDKNDNYACDADEPTAITNAQGNYSLINVGSVSRLHILAIVPVGAIDLDTNTPITTGYVLLAPASNPSAVTPLTTLVSTQMKANPSLTATEAEKLTLASNKLTGLTSTILDKDPTTSADLHKVAQAVATVISQTASLLTGNTDFAAAALVSNAGSAESQAAAQALRLTQSSLLQKLQNPDGTINNTYLTGNGVNVTVIAALATNTVNDGIGSIAAAAKGGKFGVVDMRQAIQNGISGFRLVGGGYYFDENNVEVATGIYHFMANRFSFDPSKDGKYRYINSVWRKDTKHNFSLLGGVWIPEFGSVANTVNSTQTTFRANCFTALQTPQGINLTACATSVDLAGKKLSDFNFDCKGPTGLAISGCNSNALFPAGSLGYNFQVSYDQDQYQLEIEKNAAPIAENMASFVTKYKNQSGPYLYYLANRLAMNILSYNPVTKTGILNWFDNSGGVIGNISEASRFVVENENGVDVLIADLPNIYYRMGGDGDQTTIFAYVPAGTNSGSQAGIYQGNKYSSSKAENIYFGMGHPNMLNSAAYNFISTNYGLNPLP